MWLAVSTSIATEVKEDADIVCKRQLMIEMQYGKGSQSYAGKADQTYIHTCGYAHEMQVSGHMRPRMNLPGSVYKASQHYRHPSQRVQSQWASTN